MKSFKTRILAVLLSLMMALSISVPVFAGNRDVANSSVTSVELESKAITALLGASEFRKGTLSNPTTGSNNNGDWAVFGVMRGNVPIKDSASWASKYYDNVSSNVQNLLKYPSDYARAILVFSSLNKDVTNVGGINLVDKMLEDKDTFTGTYASNAIYALLALNSKNYNIDYNNQNGIKSDDELIEALLSYRDDETGGFYYGTDTQYGTDLDTTFMALQALAPYKGSSKVSEDVFTKGLSFITDNQSETGAISSWGTDNACSTAQAIVALAELGENIDNYDKSGKTLVDGLLSMQVKSTNGFKGYTGETDVQATDQAMYALVSYIRQSQNLKSLYDMSVVDSILYPKVKPVIKLNKSSVTISQTGKTYQLKPTVSPVGAKVTYKSSNTKVASVDTKGKITAKGVGSTNIIVTASNDGLTSTSSVKVTVKLGKLFSIRAVGGHKYAKVTYSKIAGASKYYIYKFNGKSYVRRYITSKNYFVDRLVTPGKNYYYKIRGYKDGYFTNYSKVVRADVKVGIPTYVKAISGKRKVTVTFKKVKYATKYEIYKKSKKTGKYYRIATVRTNKFTDRKVSRNKRYTYKVRAVKNNYNKSLYSKIVTSRNVR